MSDDFQLESEPCVKFNARSGQVSKRKAVRGVVDLYTDGACCPNPGQGGWAFVLVGGSKRTEASGACLMQTTNNRMELTAAIEGLKRLKWPCVVRLFTDSAYLGEGLEWLRKWKDSGWRTGKRKTPVRNRDLWEKLDGYKQMHNITYHHVKAHSGHHYNELCDKLAEEAAANAMMTVNFQPPPNKKRRPKRKRQS